MLGLWGNCLVISVFRALQTHYRGIPVTNANEGTKKDACNQWFSEAGRFHILGRSGVRPVGAFALQTRTRGTKKDACDQWFSEAGRFHILGRSGLRPVVWWNLFRQRSSVRLSK